MTAFAVCSRIRTSPFRLQCFGRLGRVVLNRTDIPVAGLRQWTTVEVRFIELAEVDRFAALWAICFEVIILFLQIDKARIAAACLAAVTLVFSARGFVL